MMDSEWTRRFADVQFRNAELCWCNLALPVLEPWISSCIAFLCSEGAILQSLEPAVNMYRISQECGDAKSLPRKELQVPVIFVILSFQQVLVYVARNWLTALGVEMLACAWK